MAVNSRATSFVSDALAGLSFAAGLHAVDLPGSGGAGLHRSGGEVREKPCSGMHMVLNSLTSPGMVGASLGALAAGGHLVEIGKRDIWAHASVKAERGDALYSVLAIDLLPAACNKRLLHQLAACLSQGLGASDVAVVYGLESAAGAMRKMAGQTPRARRGASRPRD